MCLGVWAAREGGQFKFVHAVLCALWARDVHAAPRWRRTGGGINGREVRLPAGQRPLGPLPLTTTLRPPNFPAGRASRSATTLPLAPPALRTAPLTPPSCPPTLRCMQAGQPPPSHRHVARRDRAVDL